MLFHVIGSFAKVFFSFLFSKRISFLVFSLTFFQFVMPNHSFSCSRFMTDYDYLDIGEIANLCDVAYSDESKYLKNIEQEGWYIERLFFSSSSSNHEPASYGVKASNGPLTVYSFSGTKLSFSTKKIVTSFSEKPLLSPEKSSPLSCASKILLEGLDDTILADSKIALEKTNVFFPNLPNSYVHEGILQYYQKLRFFEKVPKTLGFDELMILSGHSLGGALTYLAAIELLQRQTESSYVFPNESCSLVTFGSPAVVGQELVSLLDSEFPNTANLRFAFDNDPVANWTRGSVHLPIVPCATKKEKCIFAHPGQEICLPSSDTLTHSMSEYADFLEVKKAPLTELWPEVDESKMTSASLKVISRSFNPDPFVTFQQNSRSKNLSEEFVTECLYMMGVGMMADPYSKRDSLRKIYRYQARRFLYKKKNHIKVIKMYLTILKDHIA